MTVIPIPKESIPVAYVVQYTHMTCEHCGHVACYSEFYAVSYLRARNSKGAPVKHSERCDHPAFNLPVDYITNSPRRVPFCVRCPTIDLSHLPDPPSTTRLYDLPEPVHKLARRPAAKAAAQTHKPSIKDLA